MKYLKQITETVIDKPELRSINQEFTGQKILQFITKHAKVKSKLESSTSFEKFKLSKEFKLILKTIRSDIRKSYGLFQLDKKKQDNIMKELKLSPDSLDIHKKILNTHRSTKERLDIYPALYKELFNLTGIPKKILDIGCGLNPLSFPWMNLNISEIEYIASELSSEDLKLIKDYFKIKSIKGKTASINLIQDYKKLSKLNADVCFMFKLLDSLENLEKNISHKILAEIVCKHIIVSFSTKSVTGKPMKNIRRKWFESLCGKLEFKFKLLEFPNEIFYILSK